MICGIDEAGRGPVIGPLVVAGVSIESEDSLKLLGVKDSKLHTKKQRVTLEKKIRELGEVVIEIITAKDIDKLRSKMSLNEIEANAFAKVINSMCKDDDTVYVDSASANEDAFAKSIVRKIEPDIILHSEHKSDEIYPVVSAASICAKVIRDDHIENIAMKNDVDIGSGYPSDPKTKAFLNDWFEQNDECPPYVRRSWKTVDRYIKLKKNKRLTDF